MVALVLAYGSGKPDVRAVTTVAGNNAIRNTTRSALNGLHYTGVLTGLPKNVEVVYDMDSARFMDLLVQAAAACK